MCDNEYLCGEEKELTFVTVHRDEREEIDGLTYADYAEQTYTLCRSCEGKYVVKGEWSETTNAHHNKGRHDFNLLLEDARNDNEARKEFEEGLRYGVIEFFTNDDTEGWEYETSDGKSIPQGMLSKNNVKEVVHLLKDEKEGVE